MIHGGGGGRVPGPVDGFPPGFVWGAATSAYQIEGAVSADNKGPSIWDVFSQSPGNVANNDHGDDACDHYRRYQVDVALMRELRLQAYRFSIAWSRVLPEGTGRVNSAGLDFYERLVDELLAAGIAPHATLYHWDLPAELDYRGGWLNRDVAAWFAEYAQVVAERLADRVAAWATINEPWVAAHCGYFAGEHAPGRHSRGDAAIAANNLLRAHGAALAALRAAGARQAGVVVNLTPQHAASSAAADQRAADLAHAYINRQYLEPILTGRHPDEMHELYGGQWQPLSDVELQSVSQPVDFIGVNYYLREVVAAAPPGSTRLGFAAINDPGVPRTEMGWEIYPDGLREILVWIRDAYGNVPLWITENGAAMPDEPVAGYVDDVSRINYLHDHLTAAASAIAAGVDLRGYFAWSLLDNFEWSFGYNKRFGLIHVDRTTYARTPKSSAAWYRRQIEANARSASASTGGVL